jgi:hypothetical protein
MRLTYASALKADTVLETNDMHTQPRKFSLTCPRCAKLLAEYSGGRLPPGLHIDYCNTCYGSWFDKGELAAYKRGPTIREPETFPKNKDLPLFILIEVIADILSIAFF